MNEPQEAPVKAGEVYEVKIDAVGGKGDGIARVKGFVLFVPNAKVGEFLKVKVTKVLAKVGFAEILEKREYQARSPRYETVSKKELEEPEEEESHYEDTEDFGEEENK